MTTYTSLPAFLTDIADAIRSKTGGSSAIAAGNMPTAIRNISTMSVTEVTKTLSASSNTLTLSGLSAEPKLFFCYCTGNLTNYPRVAAVFYDSFRDFICGISTSSNNNGKTVYSTTYYSWSYENGTLTITATSPMFANATYNVFVLY